MNSFKSNNYLKRNILLLIIVLLTYSCQKEDTYQKLTQELNLNKNTFVGSETCKDCHQQEFNQWQNSHHDLAMQVANDKTILGDFNNVTFKSKGIRYSFFKKGPDYYVNTEGEHGKYQDYKIEFTFGITPLQQYLIKFPNGKTQCLMVAWNTEQNKWYDLQPSLKIHHNEWMHWTGGSMNWNAMCADCHSTNLHKNYNQKTEVYDTSYSSINVSCEACHGPLNSHITYYKNTDKYKDIPSPKMYMDKTTIGKELVQKCARCHARRGQITEYFDFNGHFLDHYNPSLIIPSIYELDGQIKDEDYVYGSFVQSEMYHNGVSCKNCHDSHSLKLKKKGNALCLQCHESSYNDTSHHFHKTNTDASQCINCHMTGKTYMGIDFRRDHSFKIPRPDQSDKYGTPNACNNCHKDKSAKWASDFIQKNYGNKRADHFSDYLLAGYHGNNNAFLKLFSKLENPEIIRATALNQFGEKSLLENEIEAVLNYIKDPSALVRNEAVIALDKQKQVDVSKSIKPLLMDSIRLVRISAARYFDMRNSSKNEKAKNEYQTFLDFNADFPSGQHEIALNNHTKGAIEATIKAYENAIKIDNYYNRSRMNLALLYYQKGEITKSEKLYLKVIEQEPTYSEPYYMLGLLYNETGNTKKTLTYLSKAIEKEPVNQNAFYNYALKLQENKQNKTSVEVLIKGLRIFPNNERLLYAKLIGELNLKQDKKAYDTCLKLIKINPNNTDYRQVLERLNR